MSSAFVSLAFAYALAAIACAAAALAPLPPRAWLLLALAAAAGAAWDRTGARRVPPLALNLAGLAGSLASLLPLNRETLAEQSVTALSFLLAVKLLERKRRRDHLQILAVSLLIVAGAASLEPEVGFALLLLAAICLGVLFLLWLPFSDVLARPEPRLLRRLAVLGGGLVAASAPVSALLFVLLPRSLNPFWSGFGGRPGQAVSGVSDQLSLGDVGRVALSGAVAFRAETEDGGPLDDTPYWRGAVLEETDGRRWSVSARPRPSAVAFFPGQATRITYFVEPHGERQLFLLEAPVGASMGARLQPLGPGRALRLPLPLARRIRYTGTSHPGDRYADRLGREERELNLSLPAALSPAVRDLARRTAGDAREPREIARRLLDHFSRGYTYSLQVPAAAGDPLEAFLLGHRTGYCEYFASGLAVMLRAAGVPARVVSGYLGGEFVAAGSYYLVTQASAHAWVEAWLDGAWVRLDPTPAAAGGGGTMAARRAARPLLWLDTLKMRWNSWFVQYDAETQLSLARSGAARLSRLSRGGLDLPGAGRVAAALLALCAAGGGALLLLRGRAADPLARRVRRFEVLAARHGCARRPSEGPLDHGERVARALPAAADEARAFAALAAACRYRGRDAGPGELRRLDALLAAVRSRSRRRVPPP